MGSILLLLLLLLLLEGPNEPLGGEQVERVDEGIDSIAAAHSVHVCTGHPSNFERQVNRHH